jgi:hypothetical protein
MQALTIVVFQSDARIAQALAAGLSRHFSAVHVTNNLYELHTAILDIEGTQVMEVERLHREFPGLSIVCTHRVADEEMWARVLNAGATDMFPTCDTEGIVMSAVRQSTGTHVAA